MIYSAALANAQQNAIESTMGTAAKVRIYDGAQPASCADAATGTMLAEYTLASDWMAAAVNGEVHLNSLPVNGVALADGTPGYLRVYRSNGTTCDMQGSCGVSGSGADFIVSNATVGIGEALNIVAFGIANGMYTP